MPSEAEVLASWKDAVIILQETLKYGAVNTPNFLDMQADLVDDENSDFIVDALNSVQQLRNNLSGMVSNDAARAVLLPHIKAFGKHVIGIDTTNLDFLINNIYLYFKDNSKSVQSRNITFAAYSYVGTGNGIVERITKDAFNFSIENTHASKKTIRCVADGQRGASINEEIFQIFDANSGEDAIDSINPAASNNDRGSALIGSLTNTSARMSTLTGFQNPSFALFSGDKATPSAITGWNTDWVIVGGTDIQIDQAVYYRSFVGDTPSSLVVQNAKATGTISQKLFDPPNNTSIITDPYLPYLFQCAVRSNGTWNGTITLTMGSISKAFVVTLGTAWQVLQLTPADLYKLFALYWQNNGGDTVISIAWSKSSGSDNLYIDDVLFVPYSQFDNIFYVVHPTQPTVVPFIINNAFVFNDTGDGAITVGVIQEWFHRAFNAYLPSTTGTPTFTDP